MRSWMLLAILSLGVVLPARAGEATDPEWLTIRFLTSGPAALADALAAYEELDPAARGRVRDLLHRAERRPAHVADRWIDLAVAATGERRARLLLALDALGEPALKRFLERAKGGPVRLMQSEPSATERTVPPEEAPALVAGDERALIQIECHWIEADPGTVRDVLGSAAPTAEEPHRVIDPVRAQALLAREGKGLRILHAPRLTTFDRQPTNMTITNQVTYVRDYEAKKDDDGNVILDPIVDSIQDGLVVDLSPEVAGDRFALKVVATVADLARPMAEFTAAYEGQTARIQVPELRVSRVRAHLDLPDRGYALVGGFGSADESERLLVVRIEKLDVTPR